MDLLLLRGKITIRAVNWRKWSILWFIVPTLFLACRTAPPTSSAPDPTSTPLPPTVTMTPTITVEPTETPRPSPTPIRARLDIESQAISEEGVLIVNEVVLSDPAWVVVFNSDSGEPNEVIGATAVSFGVIADLEIEVDLAQVSETLIVQIFQANNANNVFQIDEHEPLSPPVVEQVDIDLAIELPEIEISSTDASVDGRIVFDSVLAGEDGWVVVHNFDDEELGDLVGIVHVESGLTRNVEVPLRWREASNQLVARLLQDNGQIQTYEPEIDTPVQVAQNEIKQAFEVRLPVDVVVFDQPLEEGFITVEKVTSPDDGWLAVYHDDNGQLGLIIGYAPIKAGLNEQVPVDVIDSAITDPMYIVLHEDTNPGDDFDLPLNDPPFSIDNQAIAPFSFGLTLSPYFIVRNQPLTMILEQAGVEVSKVYVEFPSWVVVQELNEEGEIGAVLGQTAVSPGLTRDVFVAVPADSSNIRVMVSLYLNSGDPTLFEIEEEVDIPLRIERSPIQVPITILSPEVDR